MNRNFASLDASIAFTLITLHVDYGKKPADRTPEITTFANRLRDDAADPDETRTAVLSCLAAGLTDEGIARSLGCSLRTAQRHIGRLMHDLNASSRFQAGMEARQRGWV